MRLTEELLGDAASGLAVLAPHGGRIEIGTDDQARVVYELLALKAKPLRAWIARGFNPTIGAHRCWHITSSEISEHSFPRLGALFNPRASRGSFAHAVAFHGQNDSEAIVIGGGLPRDHAHTALKMHLRSRVHDALRAVLTSSSSRPLIGQTPPRRVDFLSVGGKKSTSFVQSDG